MKIVALLPFKNEEFFLPTYLSSILPVVDNIITLDDGSVDKSRDILMFCDKVIMFDFVDNDEQFDMSKRRNFLLQKAREIEATHMIWLDADEALVFDNKDVFLEKLLQMKPGDKLLFDWVTLWGKCDEYLIGNHPLANIKKDFIFCDDNFSYFKSAHLSESRTPEFGSGKNIYCDNFKVLHFQFAFNKLCQLKQSWYRCVELIKDPRAAFHINDQYLITIDDKKTVIVKKIPLDWLNSIVLPKENDFDLTQNWRYLDIVRWFDKYGCEFFENLDIWHVPELKKEFIKRVDTAPTKSFFGSTLYCLKKLGRDVLPVKIVDLLRRIYNNFN